MNTSNSLEDLHTGGVLVKRSMEYYKYLRGMGKRGYTPTTPFQTRAGATGTEVQTLDSQKHAWKYLKCPQRERYRVPASFPSPVSSQTTPDLLLTTTQRVHDISIRSMSTGFCGFFGHVSGPKHCRYKRGLPTISLCCYYFCPSSPNTHQRHDRLAVMADLDRQHRTMGQASFSWQQQKTPIEVQTIGHHIRPPGTCGLSHARMLHLF